MNYFKDNKDGTPITKPDIKAYNATALAMITTMIIDTFTFNGHLKSHDVFGMTTDVAIGLTSLMVLINKTNSPDRPGLYEKILNYHGTLIEDGEKVVDNLVAEKDITKRTVQEIQDQLDSIEYKQESVTERQLYIEKKLDMSERRTEALIKGFQNVVEALPEHKETIKISLNEAIESLKTPKIVIPENISLRHEKDKNVLPKAAER